MNTCTDEDLMTLYQGGNVAAFNEIYQRHHGLLRSYIERCLHGLAPELLADVADILQNTFRFIHRYRGRFIGGTMLKPWLFSTAKRMVYNHIEYASRKRRNVFHTHRLPDHMTSSFAQDCVAADEENWEPKRQYQPHRDSYLATEPDSTTNSIVVKEEATRCMAILPANYKEVIRLIFFEELTAAETGARMGVPESTINWWKREALRLMRNSDKA